VPVFEQGAATGSFVAGHHVRLYAAPGSEVQLLMRRNANQGVLNVPQGALGGPRCGARLPEVRLRICYEYASRPIFKRGNRLL
jgi:hypothetical protein